MTEVETALIRGVTKQLEDAIGPLRKQLATNQAELMALKKELNDVEADYTEIQGLLSASDNLKDSLIDQLAAARKEIRKAIECLRCLRGSVGTEHERQDCDTAIAALQPWAGRP